MIVIKNKIFNDPHAWNILLKIYYAGGNPVPLVRNDQKVRLLEQNNMILLVSTSTFFTGYDLNNVEFPYILQPETEGYIRRELKDKN